MPGFLRAATTVCTGGAIVGAGALMLLPFESAGSLRVRAMFATVRVSDLPPAPCKQQLWPNTDRACQTWTTPKHAIERVLQAKAEQGQNAVSTDNTTIVARAAMSVVPTPQPVPRPVTTPQHDDGPPRIAKQPEALPSTEPEAPSADARLITGETSREARVRAVRVGQDDSSKAVRSARGADLPRKIPIATRSADGTSRVIMIQPTSRQDALYYSARRELASSPPAATAR
jgi:hypothetical protein